MEFERVTGKYDLKAASLSPKSLKGFCCKTR